MSCSLDLVLTMSTLECSQLFMSFQMGEFHQTTCLTMCHNVTNHKTCPYICYFIQNKIKQRKKLKVIVDPAARLSKRPLTNQVGTIYLAIPIQFCTLLCLLYTRFQLPLSPLRSYSQLPTPTMTLTLILYTSIFGFLLYSLLNHLLLRRYPKPLPPGPKPWPIIGNLPNMGQKPHQSIAAMARVYGPLMHLKMGFVHVVVAASAGVAEQFLKVHDAKFSSRPPNSGAKYLAYNYQDLVFAPYGPRWRMLRKICAVHLFSAKALDEFRHVRQVILPFS